jgi:hypothetical protein
MLPCVFTANQSLSDCAVISFSWTICSNTSENYKRFRTYGLNLFPVIPLILQTFIVIPFPFEQSKSFSSSKIPGNIITDSHDYIAAEGREINNSTITSTT